MLKQIRGRTSGVTLLELLVVLMILSIVLTAAVRTWDVTLERGRAQTTAMKLSTLVKAIEGDPDYIVTGQRADFGFVGDMGRMPDSLVELAVAPPNSPLWRGPYLRSTFSESPNAYEIDGWGDTIIYGYQAYGKDSLFLRSHGGRGFVDPTRWQTDNLIYSYGALMENNISGQIIDEHGSSLSPSSPYIGNLKVIVYRPVLGKMDSSYIAVGPSASSFTFTGIAQGTVRLVAMYVSAGTPSVTVMTTRDVPVYPGIGMQGINMRLGLDWNDLPSVP
ncbi:MAG TPA: prepilin-type N-terminal cleavage/methylation domain-containing protein [bacterium]|nr:prepilin-type N-terminal cleavage/methylation domain-containing protein [bacterium]